LSVGRRLLAVADALPVTMLAVIAGAGSFTHGRDTAAQYGQGGPQGRGRRTRRCWPRWPPDFGAAEPGDPLQPRPGGLAADQPADVAVDQPRGMGAGVEDGDGAGGEGDRDRHPGVGHLASRRREHVTCQGAGTPYTSVDNLGSASPDCGHTYTSSSAGQPDGAFQATATITWDVTWQGPGDAGGVLAPLFSTAAAAFRVAESQALDTNGT
jgi:hypothetical protein